MLDPIESKYAALEDPGIRAFMIEGERLYPADAVNFTIAQQREFYDRYAAHFRKPRPAGITAGDFAVEGIRCRHYRPETAGAHPVLLYLHGGGFVLGGLESHDDICAEICAGADVEVVAVDYRLAPEHPFPAAFEDCWTVLRSLDGRIAVAGDSAGANLAAALALKARDERRPPLAGQILIYPGLGGDTSKGSYVTQANAPGLSTADVEYYRRIRASGQSKFAEPLRETDFSGLPPAFLIAACLDPLHDDCDVYAANLAAAGIPAFVRHEPLLVHAFLRARHMSEPAKSSFRAIVEAVFSLAWHGELPGEDAER